MNSITGNPRHDAQQRLDAIGYNLRELSELLLDEDVGALTQQAEPMQAPSYDEVLTLTFGRWVLELLEPGGKDVSVQVAQARKQLIDALARTGSGLGEDPSEAYADTSPAEMYIDADEEAEFLDVFADDDLDAQQEELDVAPMRTHVTDV